MEADTQSVNIENIVSDWEKLCRICLIDQANLFPVYNIYELDEQYNMSFCEMLTICSTLKVSSNDNFPQLICSLCLTHMRHALEFRMKCQSSETMLIELFHKRHGLETVIKCEVTDVIEIAVETDTKYHEVKCSGIAEARLVTEVEEKKSQNIKSTPISATMKENTGVIKVKLRKLYLPGNNQKSKSKLDSVSSSGQKLHMCPICHKSYKYIELIAHKKTHLNTCWKCNIHFKSAEEHKEHFKEHEENVCSECGKAFKSKLLCKQHKIIHEKDKYLCSICGKKISGLGNYTSHLRRHTGEKKYDCNYCGKKFLDWGARRYHIRNHHTFEKPFACDICDGRFSDKRHLVMHMVTHSNEKPFACTLCDATYKSNSALNMHKFKHTGEKRVFCGVCNKGFIKNYKLKQHMVTHTGEKNHVCTVCNKGFSQAHVLRTHMNTHLDNASRKKIKVDHTPRYCST